MGGNKVNSDKIFVCAFQCIDVSLEYEIYYSMNFNRVGVQSAADWLLEHPLIDNRRIRILKLILINLDIHRLAHNVYV